MSGNNAVRRVAPTENAALKSVMQKSAYQSRLHVQKFKFKGKIAAVVLVQHHLDQDITLGMTGKNVASLVLLMERVAFKFATPILANHLAQFVTSYQHKEEIADAERVLQGQVPDT